MSTNNSETVSVNVVGSSTFGRYPKISLEKTYNMFISDEWMVNYAGFQKVSDISDSEEGRALFHSVRGDFLLTVQSGSVYVLRSNLNPIFVGSIGTFTGEVYIDENLQRQICIVDGESAYIYNYDDNSFTRQALTFLGNDIIPNYVCYHNTFFLISSSPSSNNPQFWYAFEFDTASTIKLNTQLSLQTKPDSALAVKRLPGKGNNVLVIGSSVSEVWTQIGGTENYRRVQSFNIDSGCVSVSTIAANEEFICFLAQNESNAPSILVTDGASTKRISSDGIDYLLQTIKFPNQSTAFFFRQDGHLFYQLTFFNPKDNLSLIYDFTNGLFFHISNEKLNYHPAIQIESFNEKTYFVSIDDGSLYQMGTEFLTYNYNLDKNLKGEVIPRKRICKTIRKENSGRFRVGNFSFWIEQGVNDFFIVDPGNICDGLLITEDSLDYIVTEMGENILAEDGQCGESISIRPRVDMSFSKTGNQTFSNIVPRYLNQQAHFRNRLNWQRMGQANEFTIQIEFWGFQRFVVQNGILEVY